MRLTTSQPEVLKDHYVFGNEASNKVVLMIHDGHGFNEDYPELGKKLEKLGYYVVAIDLYEGKLPKNNKQASEFMRQLDQTAALNKLQTTLTLLKIDENRKVAVMGWSIGGLLAQLLTLQNPTLVDALILYYCRIVIDKNKALTLMCPVLGIFAENEKTWPDKQADLELAMYEAEKVLECHSYEAEHGFANSQNVHHDHDVTQKAWKVTTHFLKKYLG